MSNVRSRLVALGAIGFALALAACNSRRRECERLVRVADDYEHASKADPARAADDAMRAIDDIAPKTSVAAPAASYRVALGEAATKSHALAARVPELASMFVDAGAPVAMPGAAIGDGGALDFAEVQRAITDAALPLVDGCLFADPTPDCTVLHAVYECFTKPKPDARVADLDACATMLETTRLGDPARQRGAHDLALWLHWLIARLDPRLLASDLWHRVTDLGQLASASHAARINVDARAKDLRTTCAHPP